MVTVIFKDVDIEALIEKMRNNAFVSKSFNFIKSNKILVRLVSICLVFVIAAAVTVLSVGITVGFDVKYSGKVIATVHDSSVFESAKNIAVQNVSSANADSAIATPKYTLTITVADKLDTAAKVADAIIENTDDFVCGTALVINGETVACTAKEDFSEKLEARRTQYYVDGAVNISSFTDKVEVESGYYLKTDMVEAADLDEIISNLSVKTISTVSEDTEIDYKTEKVRTDTQSLGYYEVTTKGEKGISRKTEKIETLNGVESSRTELSSEVIKEPVNKVITIGTAPVRVAATERARATSAGFICPINSGSYTISAYYGDGRNHKGLDFAADKGTSIFAVAAGTVTYAGYDSDYGYNIIINHGNGIETRYAHASALCVSKGASVSQGDMIATVGNTGRSTGNHLHFEVIVNGTRVNPAPYVGK